MKSFKNWREKFNEDDGTGFLANVSTQRSEIVRQTKQLMQKLPIREARFVEGILTVIIHAALEDGASSPLLMRLRRAFQELEQAGDENTAKLMNSTGSFWATLQRLADEVGGEAAGATAPETGAGAITEPPA